MEVQVTMAVASSWLPSEKVAVAVNCWLVPFAMLGLADNTVMDLSVGSFEGEV